MRRIKVILTQHGTDTKNAHIDQWDGTEDTDVNPYTNGRLFFDKAKDTPWGKGSNFKKCCWSNWMTVCRRIQIDSYLSPCAKFNSKWIKDFNIKPDTLNLIEETF